VPGINVFLVLTLLQANLAQLLRAAQKPGALHRTVHSRPKGGGIMRRAHALHVLAHLPKRRQRT
jgi:hypothetical protein